MRVDTWSRRPQTRHRQRQHRTCRHRDAQWQRFLQRHHRASLREIPPARIRLQRGGRAEARPLGRKQNHRRRRPRRNFRWPRRCRVRLALSLIRSMPKGDISTSAVTRRGAKSKIRSRKRYSLFPDSLSSRPRELARGALILRIRARILLF